MTKSLTTEFKFRNSNITTPNPKNAITSIYETEIFLALKKISGGFEFANREAAELVNQIEQGFIYKLITSNATNNLNSIK